MPRQLRLLGALLFLGSQIATAGFQLRIPFRGVSESATVARPALREFTTSFEDVSDFDGFYIVPPGEYDSRHAQSTENVRTGHYSHKAWITQARGSSNDSPVYSPHRAYPTVQLHKTAGGSFSSRSLVTVWVFLDINLVDRPAGDIDDWFSFATLTPDASDAWSRTVLVNIVHDGYARLVHVPNQGEQEHLYQATAQTDTDGSLAFPFNQWVRLDIYIDFSPTGGYAKVWQNKRLVSHAHVNGGNGTLAQAHFGLYASAAIPSGQVYNDDLTIREVRSETEALRYVNE